MSGRIKQTTAFRALRSRHSKEKDAKATAEKPYAVKGVTKSGALAKFKLDPSKDYKATAAEAVKEARRMEGLNPGRKFAAVEHATDKRIVEVSPRKAKKTVDIDRPPASASPKKRAQFHQEQARAHIRAAGDYASRGERKMENYAFAEHEKHVTAMHRATAGAQAAKKQKVQHAFQNGKRGGTFYLAEGKKIYVKK